MALTKLPNVVFALFLLACIYIYYRTAYMMRGTLNHPEGYSLRYFLRKDQILLSEQYLESCQPEFGIFFKLKNARALLEGFHQTSHRNNS
jgi:hypothetical protein